LNTVSDDKENLWSLVGYERRLHKMRRAELLTEAERVGLSLSDPLDRLSIIRHILEAQELNADLLLEEDDS
jgi:hypothetical protein